MTTAAEAREYTADARSREFRSELNAVDRLICLEANKGRTQLEVDDIWSNVRSELGMRGYNVESLRKGGYRISWETKP
jgi:hypothetical protein